MHSKEKNSMTKDKCYGWSKYFDIENLEFERQKKKCIFYVWRIEIIHENPFFSPKKKKK